MKHLPKIALALITIATLYACNKKEEMDAMNISSRRAQDTLSDSHNSWDSLEFNNPNDTIDISTNPQDTIESTNPIDTIISTNPIDTIISTNPVDTIVAIDPIDSIDSIFGSVDSLGSRHHH